MSVYQSKGSGAWRYDFWRGGHRFVGPCGAETRTKRQARAVERREKRAAEQLVLKLAAAGRGPLTIDVAAGRYWLEVGQHHANSADTWRDLERLTGWFGKDALLSAIDDDHVTRLVAWRRGHFVGPARAKRRRAPSAPPSAGAREGPARTGTTRRLVSNATVNRTTTEMLKKLFGRARRNWGHRFDREPNWKDHMLPEPKERVRVMRADEAERFRAAERKDYAPYWAFLDASGLRLKEALLRWPEVDWAAGAIEKRGKGGRIVRRPMTRRMRAILAPLRGLHPEFVFTYVARRTRTVRGAGGRKLLRVKGRRYPLTFSGVKTEHRRMRRRARVEDFRLHDRRHTFATKLLRVSNLKVVQKALDHADIKTTAKYAHALDDDVRDAMERIESHADSRKSAGEAG